MAESKKNGRRCLNRQCDHYRAGRCRLFPGWSFLDCRKSGIATTKNEKKEKQPNGKNQG